MLTSKKIEQILSHIPRLRVGVLGDLFLDRYLDLDAKLTEPSIETGLDAYQVVGVRSYPGAAGTVINNLAALGVAEIHPLSIIGDDGEGFELSQALRRLKVVRSESVFPCPSRRTPTYTKPMLLEPGMQPRELNRLDIKNRSLLPVESEQQIIEALDSLWARLDVLLVMDQVSESDTGVVTARVRQRLSELAVMTPNRLVLADSRARIGLYRHVCIKPNEAECRQALAGVEVTNASLLALADMMGRAVFCTRSERGMLVADPSTRSVDEVACFPVVGPIDPVGAGDSSSAGLACALACGASLTDSAAFGNLIASITIQQLGTTGTANPEQVRKRWCEVN